MKCKSCRVRETGFCRFVGPQHLDEYESLRIGPKNAPPKALLDWSRSGKHVHILRAGWAALFGMVPDGRAKITDVLVPGDIAPMSRIFRTDSSLKVRAFSDVEYCSFNTE